MKTKIYFGKPKFYINELKRVVVCKLPVSIYSHFGYRWNAEATGIAKCKPDDKFNKNRGMRIAKTRAENDIYYAAETVLKDMIYDLSMARCEAEEFIKNGKQIIAHNNEYIDRLSFETHHHYEKRVQPLKDGTYEICQEITEKKKKNKKKWNISVR